MRVVIEPDAAAASERVARTVADLVRSQPRCVLGLATGRTMESVYDRLGWHYRQGELSFREVRTFNLDEYVGAGRDDAWSFHQYAIRHLVGPTDLPASSVHAPDGAAADVFDEALRYEAALRAAGGIDLQLLGLGRNGHIGFNEPGSSLGSRTRAKALTEDTLRANRADLARAPAGLPQAAITVGLGTILGARVCLLLAVGAAKAKAAAAMIEGPVTARVPASVLQHHPDATVVLDRDAASALEDRAYYELAERLQRRLEEGRHRPPG